MSVRENILAAIAAALSGVASGRIYRTRREQLPTLPAVIIEPVSESGNENVLGLMDRNLVVGISVYAKGDIPDSAADSTLASIWSALMGNPSLGLSDVQLMPAHEIEWDVEEVDNGRATLRATYIYRTATGGM